MNKKGFVPAMVIIAALMIFAIIFILFSVFLFLAKDKFDEVDNEVVRELKTAQHAQSLMVLYADAPYYNTVFDSQPKNHQDKKEILESYVVTNTPFECTHIGLSRTTSVNRNPSDLWFGDKLKTTEGVFATCYGEDFYFIHEEGFLSVEVGFDSLVKSRDWWFVDEAKEAREDDQASIQ